nr:hypothetical protein [Tanacetum cinerariifolium]
MPMSKRNIDSFNDIHSHFDDAPLSGSTTYSSNSLLEEFTDELALITYPSNYDDNRTCDIKSNLKEIEFLLYQGEDSDFKDSIDQTDLANLDDLCVDPTPEMFTDEQPLDYSLPLRFDVYPDDFLEIESDVDNFYDDLFDSKGEKIKEAKLLIDQLDLSCDIFPYSELSCFQSQSDFHKPDHPTPSSDCKTKSSSTSLNSLLKKTNTFDNSLPEFETFCFDVEGISSGSTITPDISLPEYEVFYDDHIKEISSGSPTTHFDSSLYASFIFDLSINPFPPADRSDIYEFTDELSPFISLPEYDCFLFKVEPNSRDFTKDVVEDIYPIKEPQVLNALPTHPTLQLNLKF